MQTQEHIDRPDAKGRITLGKFAEGISSYRVNKDKKGRIIFEPFAEIPAHEAWLYRNPEALKPVLQGIKDTKESKLYDLGSFSQYIEDSK